MSPEIAEALYRLTLLVGGVILAYLLVKWAVRNGVRDALRDHAKEQKRIVPPAGPRDEALRDLGR